MECFCWGGGGQTELARCEKTQGKEQQFLTPTGQYKMICPQGAVRSGGGHRNARGDEKKNVRQNFPAVRDHEPEN